MLVYIVDLWATQFRISQVHLFGDFFQFKYWKNFLQQFEKHFSSLLCCKNRVYKNIYKICVNWLFIIGKASGQQDINSWVLVESKLHVDFWLCRCLVPLILMLFKGQLYIRYSGQFLPTSWGGEFEIWIEGEQELWRDLF